MAHAPVQLKVLGSTTQTQPAVLTAFSGRRLLLQSPGFLGPGALIEAEINDKIILGEVVRSVPVGEVFEHWINAHHSLDRLWQPHPEWRGASAPESVIDSLSALNTHLSAAAEPAKSLARVRARRR